MLQTGDIEAVEFGGRLVLAHWRSVNIAVLNDTGRSVWETARAGASLGETAGRLAEAYGIPLATARADVAGLVRRLRASGLIGHKDHPAQPPVAAAPARPPCDVAGSRTYALARRPIRFRFGDRALETLVHPLLGPSEAVGGEAQSVIDLFRDGADYVVAVDGQTVGRTATDEEALGLAVSRTLRLSYPEADWLAMFHAGAVGNGREAAVIPASSGSGKSTLVAALVHAGLQYFSDDVVPLDGATMRIRPVPFGICLKEGSWPVLASRYPELATLPTYRGGGRRRRYLAEPRRKRAAPAAGLPVKCLVFARYRRGERRTRWRALSPIEALERIAEARVWIPVDRGRFSRTLVWIQAIPSFELNYNALEHGVAAVQRLLNGDNSEHNMSRGNVHV